MSGNLETQLRFLFSSPVVTRGRTYFLRKAVRIASFDDATVSAVVTGSDRYKVTLRRARPMLQMTCTCPFMTDYQKPCKHLWAAVLACDDEGIWRNVKNLAGLPDEEDTARETPEGMDPLEAKRISVHLKQNSPHWKYRLLKAQDPIPVPAPPRDGDAELFYSLHLPVDGEESEPLTLQLLQSRKLKNGSRGAFFPVRYETAFGMFHDSPEDEQVLSLLQGFKPADDHGVGQSQVEQARSFTVTPPAARLLLPLACATGRCLLDAENQSPEDPTILSWDEGEPWTLRLALNPTEEPSALRLDGRLARGEENLTPDTVTSLGASGLFLSGDRIHALRHPSESRWIAMLAGGPVAVPARDTDDFLAAFFQGVHVPDLTLPEGGSVARQTLKPQPCLVFRAKKPQGSGRLTAELSFDYLGERVVENQPGSFLYRAAERTLLLRDHAFEKACGDALEPLGFPWITAWGGSSREGASSHLMDAVSVLAPRGWRVEAAGKLYRGSGQLRGGLSSATDWFDLRLEAVFDGVKAPVEALLSALRRGERFIRLDDGSTGVLPEEWLRRYGFAVRLGDDAGDGRLRFNAGQAGLLDALLAEQPEVSFDATFERVREKLSSFENLTPTAPPRSFHGKLRPYQKTGLGWLSFLRDFGFGGCLADDMGLGKTVQVLAMLEARRALRVKDKKIHPSLVVVPKSLVFNWREEAAKFTPKLRVLEHVGVLREAPGKHFDDYDLILTTYGTLRRDAAEFASLRFDYVVLDEAHAVKNPRSESAKAVRLLQGDHRLALTGTPVQNHLGELWSLFEFLNPGMLGASTLSLQAMGGEETAGPAPEPALMARALKPFLLRRTKEKVASDLPPKTEQVLQCVLGPEQQTLYESLKNHYRESLLQRVDREGLAKSKMHVLEALLRLRQAACHPGLINPAMKTERGSKLDALIPSLEEVLEEGHKALVFSQFTSFLDIVREHLAPLQVPYAYLDGATRDREEQVKRFQEDKSCGLFLISLKAGGLGLNLTEAEYVYLLDPWWNPAVEAQAIDRSHRIGQTRKVTAYRLISKGTVEEKILEMQKAKKNLADAVLNPEGGLLGDLTREDLEMLLS